MANTVSVLSYANTFGDWVVATNALAREHNDLVANNWTKSTGTLYLTDPSLGIQVSGAAIVAGALQVQGTGSSAYVQNNIRIDGTLAATNSTNSIYSTGAITSLGRVNANAAGLGLFVANNFTVGNISNTNILFVTSNTTTGNLQTQYTTTTQTLSVNASASISSAYVQNNIRIDGTLDATNSTNSIYSTGVVTSLGRVNANASGLGLFVANNFTVGGTANASNLFVTSTTTTGNLQTQYTTTTQTLSVNASASIGTGLVVSTTISAGGRTFTDTLTANNGITTTTVSANGTSSLNIIQANNITVTANIISSNVRADNLMYANALTVGNAATVDRLTSNTSINSNTFTSNTATINGLLTSNSLSVGTGGISVQGDFVINGTAIYNTPNFTISANSSGQDGFFSVYRNTSNASIKWSEANTSWYLKDVSSYSGNNYFYKILTTQYLTDSLVDSSSSNVASSKAANTLQSNLVTANTSMKSYVDTANTSMKSYVDTANTSMKSYVDTANTSMKSYVDTANTSMKSYVDTANTSMKSYVDNINTIGAGVNTTQNTNITTANNAAWAAYAAANLALGIDATQNTNITTANNAAWAGYARANTSSNTFVGTSGSASPSTGVISFNSTNGITISGTSNVLTISTSQNLQTNGTPTFATVTLSSPSTAPTAATNTSNTQIATTAFVQNQLNNGNTYTHTSAVTNSVTVVNDSSTNATMYPVWVVANSGNNALRTSSGNYYFNPSTGSLNATNFNSLSDENRKENIYQITNATDIIKQINGYGFNWKDNGKKSYGHIAQHLEKILPDLVDTNDDGVKSVNYNGLIAFLVETVKEMDKRITELESK